MSSPLRIISAEAQASYQIMRARQDRAARIDALNVDRSRVAGIALPQWSAEALEAGEQRREYDRGEVTVAEKMEAWRGLFSRIHGARESRIGGL